MSRRSGEQSTGAAHVLLRAVGVLVAAVAAFFVLSALHPSTASAAGTSDDGTDSPLLVAAGSLLEPVIEAAAPVAEPVLEAAAPVAEPVLEAAAPVVAVAAPVIEPVAAVAAPVVAVPAPVVAVVVEPVAAVAAPVLEAAAPVGQSVRSLIQTTDMANLIDMMVGTVDDTVRAATGPVLDRVGTVVTDVGVRVEAVTGGVSDIVNEVGQQADSVLPNPTVPNWPSHPTWPEMQPEPVSVAPSPASETDVIDPTTQALLARWQTSPSVTAGTTFAAPSASDTSVTIRPSDTSVTMLDGVEFGTTAKALSGPLTGAAIAVQISGSSAGGAPSGRDQNPPHVAVLSSSAGGVSWFSRGVTTDVSWTSASVSLSIECPG